MHYSNVDLLINEYKKELIINPIGERFYHVACEDLGMIFKDATFSFNADKDTYVIDGNQIIYTEHYDTGMDYERLLCLHPSELIKKKGFFGFSWFSVNGVLKREVKSRYVCKHKEYSIHERLEVLSSVCEEK